MTLNPYISQTHVRNLQCCTVCKGPCGTVHCCDVCGKRNHIFCGIPIGDEGYGQPSRCHSCQPLPASGSCLNCSVFKLHDELQQLLSHMGTNLLCMCYGCCRSCTRICRATTGERFSFRCLSCSSTDVEDKYSGCPMRPNATAFTDVGHQLHNAVGTFV